MNYWILILFLFCSVLFYYLNAPKVGSGRINRETKYVFTEQEFHDTLTWQRLSDSLNKTIR